MARKWFARWYSDECPPWTWPVTVCAPAVIALSALSGCDAAPKEVGRNEFDPNKVAYFKDSRTGVCFSVASFSRLDTGGRMASGMSHSAVPCTPAVEALAR